MLRRTLNHRSSSEAAEHKARHTLRLLLYFLNHVSHLPCGWWKEEALNKPVGTTLTEQVPWERREEKGIRCEDTARDVLLLCEAGGLFFALSL